MKKLTILFLVCLFTSVAVISAYDHPIAPQLYGSCKPCEPHKGKRCDVCCYIDHISAATEESGEEEIIALFNSTNGFNPNSPGPFALALTFQEQLTKSGDSIILVKPNTFLFLCPGQYCVEFSGCVEAIPQALFAVEDFVIVFLVNGEILQPVDPRFVFPGPTEEPNRMNCFFKSAVVQVPDEVSCTNPFPFQVAFRLRNATDILDPGWQNIHYSIKITHITDSKCKIAPLNLVGVCRNDYKQAFKRS